jgi:hypothetical protein
VLQHALPPLLLSAAARAAVLIIAEAVHRYSDNCMRAGLRCRLLLQLLLLLFAAALEVCSAAAECSW